MDTENKVPEKTKEEEVRDKIAAAPHPKTDNVSLADISHLPESEQKTIHRARQKRLRQQAARAKRAANGTE